MSEWKTALDKARNTTKFKKGLTQAEIKFIKYARDNPYPVSYRKIEVEFEKHFGYHLNKTAISERWEYIKRNNL